MLPAHSLPGNLPRQPNPLWSLTPHLGQQSLEASEFYVYVCMLIYVGIHFTAREDQAL